MNTPNPNVCPTCDSRNTGATFGWEPQRVNADETILTGRTRGEPPELLHAPPNRCERIPDLVRESHGQLAKILELLDSTVLLLEFLLQSKVGEEGDPIARDSQVVVDRGDLHGDGSRTPVKVDRSDLESPTTCVQERVEHGSGNPLVVLERAASAQDLHQRPVVVRRRRLLQIKDPSQLLVHEHDVRVAIDDHKPLTHVLDDLDLQALDLA